MMGGYDYGNARLRAMKSRLFSRSELEQLAEAGSLRELMAQLAGSVYARSVEAAAIRASGMDVIDAALHRDLTETLGKIRRFYTEAAYDTVMIALRKYDIHNLKAILRGLSKHVSSDQITGVLLPLGELPESVLNSLIRLDGPREAIDVLASMRWPIAQPLLKLRAERPGVGVSEMELALDQWYFHDARQALRAARDEARMLLEALDLEADLINLLTVLRLAYAPAGRQLLNEWLGTDDFRRLFVEPGHLPIELLAQAGARDTLDAAVTVLAKTHYGALLAAGLDSYHQVGQLSVFEKQLNRHRLQWMARLIMRDALGIGVVLGYLALKTNEVNNIRWVAQGINLGLQTGAIKNELEFVA